MNRIRRICMCLLGGLFLTGAATHASADAWNKKTYVTFGQPIEVPGAVLPPGKYVFKLLDSPSNRNIVQIMNAEENHVFATNLAIPIERAAPSDKTILTFYEIPGGGPEPIRTWFYPGDTLGQQFAYSKRRTKEIALAMNQVQAPGRVLAQREPAAAPSGPAASGPTPASTPSVAAGTPGPDAAPAQQIAQSGPEPQQAQQQQDKSETAPPAQVVPDNPRRQLPQTAGNMPAIGLLGVCCLAIAGLLRMGLRRSRG